MFRKNDYLLTLCLCLAASVVLLGAHYVMNLDNPFSLLMRAAYSASGSPSESRTKPLAVLWVLYGPSAILGGVFGRVRCGEKLLLKRSLICGAFVGVILYLLNLLYARIAIFELWWLDGEWPQFAYGLPFNVVVMSVYFSMFAHMMDTSRRGELPERR